MRQIKKEFPEKRCPTYIGDKFPDYIIKHHYIRKRFPEARTICIFRNPLDVINSMMFRRKVSREGGDPSWNRSLSLGDGVAYWKLAWSLLLKDERIIPLKYEDLISHPSRDLERLADILGLVGEFDTSLLSRVQKPGTIRVLTSPQLKFVNHHLGSFISNWQVPLEELREKYPLTAKPALLTTRIRFKGALDTLSRFVGRARA
jgi:hypothetical protein